MKYLLLFLLTSLSVVVKGQSVSLQPTWPVNQQNRVDTVRVLLLVSDTSEVKSYNGMLLAPGKYTGWSMYGYRVTKNGLLISYSNTGRIYLYSTYLDDNKKPLPKGYAVFHTLDLE